MSALYAATLLGSSVYVLLYSFLAYSFLGVVIEGLFFLGCERSLESRSGLLYLPLRPLDGVGGCAFALLLRPDPPPRGRPPGAAVGERRRCPRTGLGAAGRPARAGPGADQQLPADDVGRRAHPAHRAAAGVDPAAGIRCTWRSVTTSSTSAAGVLRERCARPTTR